MDTRRRKIQLELAFMAEGIRRRLRCVYWRRWKRGTKRFAELRKRDVGKDLSAQTAGGVHGPWRISRSPALSFAFPNAHFNALGLALLAKQGYLAKLREDFCKSLVKGYIV